MSARVPAELASRPFKLRVMASDAYDAMLETGGDDLKSHLDWIDCDVNEREGSRRVSVSLRVPSNWRGERIRFCFVDAEALESAAHRKGVGGHQVWQIN